MLARFDDVLIDRVFQPVMDWFTARTGVSCLRLAAQMLIPACLLCFGGHIGTAFVLPMPNGMRPIAIVATVLLAFCAVRALRRDWQTLDMAERLFLLEGALPRLRLDWASRRRFLIPGVLVTGPALPWFLDTAAKAGAPDLVFWSVPLTLLGLLGLAAGICCGSCIPMPPPTKRTVTHPTALPAGA